MIPLHGARGERRVEQGRCLYEGYQRALSLQYGGMSDTLNAHPLYAKARDAIGGRSVVSPHKRENMFLMVTNYFGGLESQNIIEFGSWAGGNAIFLATALAELYPQAKVYALDTYKGMPTVDEQYDMVEAGRFQVEGGVEGIRAYAASLGLTNIEFVQGLFQDTLPGLLSTGVKFALAHVDADIYSACKYAQDTVWPSLVKGAYITYDDPLDSTNMGAMQALEEMIVERGIRTEQMYPHPVLRAHL